MRACVYARKSDDDDGKGEHKSVIRQIEHAKAFAQKHGWTVDEADIFSDDAISGAEYTNRPGLARLMAALPKQGLQPPFDALIMSESSRLGRDMTRNAAFMVAILEAGVRVFYYLTGEEEKADTPEQKIVLTLRSYASEVERLKAGQRSRDALVRKAKAGHSTGGLCYGYDLARLDHHSEFRINPEQAAVIVGIYECYRDGYGHACIAKALNGVPRYAHLLKQYFGGIAPPRPRQGNRGTGSWSASAIYEILHNERYGGTIVFGEYRTIYKGGTAKTQRQKEPLRVSRPELAIVPEPLWTAVQARLAAVRASYLRTQKGQLFGRPERGTTARHLLSGLLRCASCGGSMTASGVPLGSGATRRVVPHYRCSAYIQRGTCNNRRQLRTDIIDGLVLDAVRRQILTEDAVRTIIGEAIERLAEEQRAEPDLCAKLRDQRAKVQKELDRFVAVIAEGKAPERVLQEIRQREDRIAELDAELERHALATKHDPVAGLEEQLRASLAHYQDLLRADVPVARQALRRLLGESLQFNVTADGYYLEGATPIGALLFSAIAGVASPRDSNVRINRSSSRL